MGRIAQPDVVAIVTATKNIFKGEGQVFYRTEKTWELWQEEPLALVKRWPRKRVMFVLEKDDFDPPLEPETLETQETPEPEKGKLLMKLPFTRGAPRERHQINNFIIKPTVRMNGKESWMVCAPDGRELEEFDRVSDADDWARDTWDFLHPDTVRGRINAAWRDLKMPKLEQQQVVKEHGQWWVTGWDREDERCIYSVHPASGSGTSRGMAFA